MNDKKQSKNDLRCHSVGKNDVNGALLCKDLPEESYKLIYVYEGVCTIDIDGMPYGVPKGYSALIYPTCRFTIHCPSGARYVWLEFSGFVVDSILSRIAFSKTAPVVGPVVQEGFENKFDIPLFSGEIYTLYRQGGGVMLLLSYYIEYFPSKMVKDDSYVFRACRYIDRHIETPGLNVRDVANALKIDRSYLYRLFIAELGMSVMEYINHRRMSKAMILLANSTLSIKDIAYSAGYSDQMYFSRVFKQYNGETPTHYRERLLTGNDTPKEP